MEVYPLVIEHSHGTSLFKFFNAGLVRWENHLFLWAMASMAMLVITKGYIYFILC